MLPSRALLIVVWHLHTVAATQRPRTVSVASEAYLACDQPNQQQAAELRERIARHAQRRPHHIVERMGHALRTAGDIGRGFGWNGARLLIEVQPGGRGAVWDSFKPERTHWTAVSRRRNPMDGSIRVAMPLNCCSHTCQHWAAHAFRF